jgi:hypothetical protein
VRVHSEDPPYDSADCNAGLPKGSS